MKNNIDTLIQKFLDGNASEQEELILEQYLLDNPIEGVTLFELEKNDIDSRLRKKLELEVPSKPMKTLPMYWKIGVSAAAILLVCITLVLTLNPPNGSPLAGLLDNTINNDGIEVKNTSKIPRVILLEDGTKVILEPNSYITYPEHFLKENRKVHLFGEAFFKVKPNPNKPFIVYTENIVTQVLGTSFRIKSFKQSEQIEVSVVSGKVSVYESSNDQEVQKNGIILTPNQKVSFKKNDKKMDISIIPEPIIQIPDTLYNFKFNEEPVNKVFNLLYMAYGIHIEIENNHIQNCTFTGDLGGLTMNQQLELVCRSINGKYEKRGTSIFVTGTGCP